MTVRHDSNFSRKASYETVNYWQVLLPQRIYLKLLSEQHVMKTSGQERLRAIFNPELDSLLSFSKYHTRIVCSEFPLVQQQRQKMEVGSKNSHVLSAILMPKNVFF